MRTPEQVKWDFVQQWLDKAHQDLVAAAVLLRQGFEDYENVGFHAQQATDANNGWPLMTCSLSWVFWPPVIPALIAFQLGL